MNNKYLYIGDNKIAGPLEKKKPMFSAWDMMANDATGQADRKIKEFETYIASLPKIEVVKEPTHSWEINKILVEGVDFRFKDLKGVCLDFDEPEPYIAVPVSKPNTDVNKSEIRDIGYGYLVGDNGADMLYIGKTDFSEPVKLNTQYSEQNYSKGEGEIRNIVYGGKPAGFDRMNLALMEEMRKKEENNNYESSDSTNSIDIGDAPFNSRNTD